MAKDSKTGLTDKHAGGRPTKYLPEYCDLLITHMDNGYSFQSFAGLVNVSKDTLYEWEKNYIEFSDAKKIGFEKSRLFWEKIGIDLSKKNFGNPTAFIFNMKNRFPEDWREKHEIEHSGGITWSEEKTYLNKDE